MMTWFWSRVRSFSENQDGVTAIEYAIIMAVISGTLVFTLPYMQSGLSNTLTQLASAVDSGSGSSGDDGEEDDESDDESSDDSDYEDDDYDEADDDSSDDDSSDDNTSS